MFDLALLQGAISGLNTLAQTAKGFNDLKTMSEVQTKAIELQSVILSVQSGALAAQSEQSAMLQRISDLEKEIAKVKGWERIKERYELKELTPGLYVWASRSEDNAPEPPHWICVKCYEEGKRSIIQKREGHNADTFICFECRNEFIIKKNNGNRSRGNNPGGTSSRFGGSDSWMGS
jgi:hypothetical protein